MVNDPNTRASTTIAALATATITIVAAIDTVDSLAVKVTIACAASIFNTIAASASSEVTTYLI